MSQTELTGELERAEGLMLQGQADAAAELLARLAEDAEEYVDKNCPTTDEVQWFSFPTLFERLAYRRVEKDPRELRDVGEPLDRLYNDLALANVQAGDYDAAMAALKRAVRWNPMDCSYRLNLADLFRVAGDMQEYLALTYTVFERASDPRHLARAFVNFSGYFEVSEKPRTAAAALRAARALDVTDGTLARLSGNFESIRDYLMADNDPDLVLRDFHAYVQAWDELTADYADRRRWNKSALHNTAKAGYFSSDRTIREYMADIWHV